MTHSKSKIQNPKSSLPRYPRYKDSGIEWLGEIPEHWEVSKTRWLWKEVEDPSENGDEQLLSISQYTGVTPTSAESRSESLVGYRRCKPEDLAMNIMLAWQGGLGVSDYAGIVSPAYSVFRLRSDNNAHYLGYLYRTKHYLDEFGRHSTGIVPSRWRLYPDKFGHVLTLLPPKPEQDRIVTFLNQKTAEIDALIAKKQRQIELLDEQKSILINRAVTRGLNPDAKLKPSGIEWIGKIPEHWEVKKLRWLLRSSVKNGISPPISEKGRVPTLSIAAVKNGQVTFGENVKFTAIHKSEAASYLLREGDILALRGNGSRHLVATAGIVGTDVPEGCIYPDLLIRIQPENLIAPHYLVIQLNGVLRDGINLAAKTSAGIWKVSGESLSAQQVLLPPFDEQERILDYVGSIQQKTALCKSGITREIQSLKNLRSTLIAHAVTGRIKV